jgi:hypothetical protein
MPKRISSRPVHHASSWAPIASLAVALVACGGAPPPPAAAPAPLAPVAAPAPPPPDLGPIAEPQGVVVFARASKPSAALQVVGGWAGLPMPNADDLGRLVAGESLRNLFDLDQPIDFALVLRGRSLSGAISAAVRSLDEAKAALSKYKLTPCDDGALLIEGLGKPVGASADQSDGEARVCELAPAFGSAATRIVCAESDEALRTIGPWLLRGAPRLTFPADVHVDVRLGPVRALVDPMRRALPILAGAALHVHRSEIQEINETFHAAIDDLADFTSDCDTIALDAMLGDAQGVATVTAQFRSATSLIARLAVSHPERAGAPPPAFWKLPADTDAAFFHRGVDAHDFEATHDRIGRLVAALLGHEGLDEPDRNALSGVLMHGLDFMTARSWYGKGIDADAAAKAVGAIRDVKDGDDAAREEAERLAAEKMAGWSVIGLDVPSTSVVALEKEAVAAWARGGVATWAKTKWTDSPAPTIKMTPAPKSLGVKDATQLEVAVYRPHPAESPKARKKKPAGKPLVLHVLVVPDGASSAWVVLAADEDLAVAKAKEVLAGGGALASRPGLAPLKDAHVTSAGFLSARGLGLKDSLTWVLATPWHHLSRESLAAVAAAPDHGTTPILFQTTAQPGSGSTAAGTFSTTVTIPRAAIASLVGLVLSL